MTNGERSGTILPDRAGGTSSSDASGKPPANVFPWHESLERHIESLEQLGFVDARTEETAYTLAHVPYSHLSYYFRLATSDENPHAPSVRTVHDLVVFDRDFQSVIFKYIGVVESQLRAQYSHWLSFNCGDFAHYNEAEFIDASKYHSTYKAYAANADKAKRNNVVIRNVAKGNGGQLPIGYAVQTMSLGVLSRFFANTRSATVTRAVANSFGSSRVELSGWLRAISDVRNICAHFGAYISRRQMPTTPKRIRGLDADSGKPPYVACLLARLLGGAEDFADFNLDYVRLMIIDLCSVVLDFQLKYPELSREIGFPDDWALLVSEAARIGAKRKAERGR